MKFIDLFAGCGGLSLGLSMARMKGIFAIEKDALAFRTFHFNFVGPKARPEFQFAWPHEWLPAKAMSVRILIDKYRDALVALAGEVDIIAGGPPCQGFSFAGRRDGSDPRNELFRDYVRVVDFVRPRALILENVPGMAVVHSSSIGKSGNRSKLSYLDKLKALLQENYDVTGKIVDPVLLGVPQRRNRLIVVGIRRDVAQQIKPRNGRPGGVDAVFHVLQAEHEKLCTGLGIRVPVTTAEAISDLETAGNELIDCRDPDSPPGFKEAIYRGPSSAYQRLMHRGHEGQPMDSMRLANHRPHVVERFASILREFGPGHKLNAVDRERFGLLKHRVCTLEAHAPSRTVTTLPDDLIHYSEPRILTVREVARLQSFPDWFMFKGKYTTGGERRTKECPRYTQVGNAVPPLLGRAIGLALREVLDGIEASDGGRGGVPELAQDMPRAA